MIANMAVELRMSPREILELSPRMLFTLQRVLEGRARSAQARR